MDDDAALCIAGGIVFAAFAWWLWSTAVAQPWELRVSPIVFAESVFRLDGAVSITARVDRVYRNAAGLLVLVELKTRKASVSHWSDVIELSAQRVAVMGQTGQAVAKHAYVLTETRAGRRSGWHRVELMSAEDLTALDFSTRIATARKDGSRMDARAGLVSNMPIRGRVRSPSASNTKVIATVAKSRSMRGNLRRRRRPTSASAA